MKKFLAIILAMVFTTCLSLLVACGPSNFTVNYYDGDQLVYSETVPANTVYTPDYDYQKPGYTFNGWTISDGTTYEDVAINANLDLFADFSANQYTITYDVNGGNALASNTQTVVFGEQTALAVPTANLLSFDGWYFGEDLVEDGAWDIACDVTLVAKWIIPDSLFTVNESDPSVLTGVVNDAKVLESIVIPEKIGGVTITEIGDSAFKDNSALKSVTIPSSVTKIGISAFENCTNLVEVKNLHQSITEIKGNAFKNCSSLTEVDLSACPLTDIWSYTFQNCTAIKNLILPNTVQTIYSYAFDCCTSVVRFTSPDSVTSIKGSAFSDCTNLAYIDISDQSNLTELKDWAFGGCYNLTNFTFPKNLSTLSTSAFSNCTKITEIRDLSTAQWTKSANVNQHSFNWFVKYTYTETDGEQKLSIDKDGFIIFGTELVGYAGNDTTLTIPSNVTKIGYHAFYELNGVKNVVIPDGVVEIAEEAFSKLPNLISLTVPSTVTTCSSGAIISCPRLFEVFWYANSSLFYNLYNPTGNNKEKLPPVRHFAQGESSALNFVGDFITYSYIQETSSGPEERNYVLSYTGTAESVTIPDGITHIYEGAFRDNIYIKNVTLSSSVKYLGVAAFAGCTNLSSISLSNLASYDGLGASCFSRCTSLKNITLPDSIATIPEYCFNQCGLLSIDLNNVSNVNRYAFADCTSLTTVTCSTNLRNIKDYVFKNTNVTTINYSGTVSEWKSINKEGYWYYSIGSKVTIVCTDGNAKVN